MSSGGRNRNNKTMKVGTNRPSGVGPATEIIIKQTKSDQNHSEKIKELVPHKIVPTAEQMRIAQMIDNTDSEKILQEKINQVMQVTGLSTDDAIVALHDCDNDVNAAIDALLEGEDQGEWRESTKKKKKAPAVKGKDDPESNKENRKVDGRDKSGGRGRGGPGGSSSRSRGRGGNRGGRDDEGSRMPGNRRGRMTNGNAPVSRGRGGRGRGGSMSNSRTFQKRQPQPPGFTETIDTWGPPEKVETNDTLHIEYWDDAQSSATTEDWDNEWTGSLDKTTVFSPSTAVAESVSPLHTVPDLTGTTGSGHMNEVENQMNSVVMGQVNNVGGNRSVMPDSVGNVLSLGQTQPQHLPNTSLNDPRSFASEVPSSGSLSQGQAIDLAALLQKAAPHSTLGRLPPSQMVDTSGLSQSSLVGEMKNNILAGITSSVGENLNSGMLSNNSVSSVPSSQSYSASSVSMNNSIFNNSDLGNSLSSGNNVSKVLGLSQNPSLTSRSKPQRPRLTQSKIPSEAVEMPEVAMAALDMQFTGLEFGTETFDFTSDVKSIMPNISNSVGPRDQVPVASMSVTKDMSSLTSSISQSQSLGPQPIPFPSQPTDRTSQSNLLSGPPQRVSEVSGAAHSLADLTKKDVSVSAAAPSLGNLVGSVSSSTHSYQTPSGGGYGSKVSAFPSPPTHHFGQSASQSYPGSTSGPSSNSYVGSSGASSNAGVSNSVAGTQSGQGYGSGFNVSSAPYQNNYVAVSSHSLTSMSASKPHSNIKDPSQSYGDASGNSGSLGSSLSTASGAAGQSSSSSAGLSLNLVSPPASPIQPSKSTVPGKSMNSLGSAPPGVQRHTMTQQPMTQQHQSHLPLQQHLNQQSQQTQQLLAGHSQYVSPQQAGLPGTLPPPFFNVQTPAMYSFEDLQMFQQRIPHMPQAPSTLPGNRDASITSPPSYSITDANKFRTDQSSSPVPSTMNQQGAAAGATYITTPGNAGVPFYMYPTMPAVPSSFSQYGTPAIIQIPSNTHTGSTTTQFPGPPKLPYGGTSAYYDNMSQTQDYKSYGSGSQGQNKSGPNSTGSVTNSTSDLAGYKNHLSKVGRSYEKQAYHTGTPPPFNLAGSGTNPIAPNYTPMFIPTMQAAQHHSTLMHHQLHQVDWDGSSSAGQRGGAGGVQNKGPSKGPYTGSYWGS